MPGIDKTTGRVVAVIALIVLAAVALRGYLPAGERERPPPKAPTDNPASLLAVAALLAVTIVIITIAIVTTRRDPRPAPEASTDVRELLGGKGGRRTWRFWVILIGVVAAGLVIIVLLSRLGPLQVTDQPPPGTGSGTPATGDGPAPPAPSAPKTDRSLIGILAASTVAILLLLVAGAIVDSRRQRRGTQRQVFVGDGSELPMPASGSETLARAAELGLAEIGDLSREPREAIIACYAAMERGLANAPGAVPQDSDTPSEVLARAVAHRALRVDSATQLVDLFAEARFSPHVMNEGHREIAVRVLQLVLAELRSVA